MTFASLFAGIGGFDLGLERAGMRCVAQVECDETLAIRCNEWDAETGEPVWESIELECDEWEFEIEADDDEILVEQHRGFQCDWQPVIDRVTRWCQQRWAELPEYEEESDG